MRLFTAAGSFYFLLWLAWSAVIIGILVFVGGHEFVRFFSRWMYVFVWGYYTLWFTQYASGPPMNFSEKLSYALLFFFHGSVWIWTIFTVGLLLVGAPTVFEDEELLERDDIGFIVLGLGLTHFTPILFIVLYVVAHRTSIANFYTSTHANSVRAFGSVVTLMAEILNVAVLPTVPIFVFIIFFDPFVVYRVDRDAGPFWAGAMITYALAVIANFTLIFYLYHVRGTVPPPLTRSTWKRYPPRRY